ncbi:putative cyclin [Lupinus albus]|uniref:Putative cyclin n=1 Tax=Lupinus albus TaxID=3870 RepID=A0A6A4QH81_LUPAL|nr:putative cyclin [Lupinus albus]
MVCVMVRTYAKLYKHLLLFVLPQMVSLTIYTSCNLCYVMLLVVLYLVYYCLKLKNLASRLRSSLWLQFKPHHIAAGAAYLASKFLNMDLAAHDNIWLEFQATPSILQDVLQQLMELF